MEPPATRAHAREAPSAADRGGGAVGEFFAALGDSWRLTGAHRARLTPAVKDALSMGWTPAALAAFTGANTDGVRNPYAVLATRLSTAELPPPAGQRPVRPPWCGTCDERTRRRQDAEGDDAGRCPACHPLAGDARPAGPSPMLPDGAFAAGTPPDARGGHDTAIHGPPRATARRAAGGHDSVRLAAYDSTRARLAEGVR